MLSVDEAIVKILAGAEPLSAETVSLSDVNGRIAAVDIAARMTQPPFSASAMDGYAVRFEDVNPGARLRVIGEAPAGTPFAGSISEGEAVRIFTGGAVPEGADHVVIQEDVARDGDEITIESPQERPRNIRPAGVDFSEGDILVKTGERLHELHGSILAAANAPEVSVRRRPKVVLFSNGDELREPGADLKPGEIINSNHYALTALADHWGGEAIYLGCAADEENVVKSFFEKAQGADIILPIGGASVGDYDYVKPAFRAAGGETVFEKIAVKPGKPTWFGRLARACVVGLAGNPASAIVCAALFVQPLVRRLAGEVGDEAASFMKAKSETPLSANGGREAYLRAEAIIAGEGPLRVRAADNQDSSLLSPFTSANALIRRKPNAPAIAAGDDVEIVRLR